jgi:hypothetical protein
MDEPDFRAGNLSIRYLEEHSALLAAPEMDGDLAAVAALAALLEAERREDAAPGRLVDGQGRASAWWVPFDARRGGR